MTGADKMTYTISNDHLTCTIDSKGAELKSVKDRKTNKEYMWNGDPAYWNRTSPVLFPFVGAVKGKEYRYNGKTYEMSQHGFARDMEFSLISNTSDEIQMELTDTEGTLTKYPFHFRLKIGYQLNDRALTVIWRVENWNENDMFFAIGAHPGFMMPRE